jgi:hypothetical protein
MYTGLAKTIKKERDNAVRLFSQLILHGDEEHRQWLLSAAECFISSTDMPPPRGGGIDA